VSTSSSSWSTTPGANAKTILLHGQWLIINVGTWQDFQASLIFAGGAWSLFLRCWGGRKISHDPYFGWNAFATKG